MGCAACARTSPRTTSTRWRPARRGILKNIDEPINLYFYFTREAADQVPYIKTYANRVRELLEEFAARANGKIRLQVIDPEPFSEAQDRADEFGLSAVPLGASGQTCTSASQAPTPPTAAPSSTFSNRRKKNSWSTTSRNWSWN